jgi:tetratricopeptide (TPR) repeat protein
MQNKKLLPIDTLDQGFVRPAYAGQVQVSYMQAGLICDFIARRWGHEALVVMLQAFAEGQNTADALRVATGMTGEEFDDGFNRNLEVIYGDIVDSLGDYARVEQQLGSAVELEDWVSVAALARDMIRRYPQRVGKRNAYEVLADAQRKLAENDKAMATLVSWYEHGGHEPATLQLLAQQLRDSGRDAEAAAVLQSLNQVMPYASEEHRWLGEHYLENQQPGNAIREFDALLGLQPDDPAAAYLGKAQAARQLGDAATARRQVVYALEHAPFYRSAQHLLLELNSGDRID